MRGVTLDILAFKVQLCGIAAWVMQEKQEEDNMTEPIH